jgi:hypothetical protein
VSSVQAQGLLWKLPEEEKSWCRYEGTYKQIVRRPQSAEGDLTLQWVRHLTIKSLGREDAEYKGEAVTCRWVEIKQITGHINEGVIDAGPGGNRIYKLLIPEKEIRGTLTEPLSDNREMFVSYIPIVKGYRKIGEEPAAAIEGSVFDLYPMVSFLRHFRKLESSENEETITTPFKELSGKSYKGDLISETPTLRTTTVAEMFRSDEAPFGVAKWTAKVNTETKQSTAPRSTFVAATEITEDMSLVEVGGDAETELVTDGQQ